MQGNGNPGLEEGYFARVGGRKREAGRGAGSETDSRRIHVRLVGNRGGSDRIGREEKARGSD